MLATKPFGVPVHALPLLGHGPRDRRRGQGSDYRLEAFADDLEAQIDALGLPPCALVAHSLGAFVASMVVARSPHRFSRVLLEEIPVPAARRTWRVPVAPHSALAMWLGAWWSRDHIDPHLVMPVLRQLSRPKPGWWRDWADIDLPMLVVAGGKSSYLDQSRYPELVRVARDARLVTIEAGHRVHIEAEDRFLDVAVPFLTGIERPASGWNHDMV